MPTESRKAFDNHATDIKRLLEIHATLGGDAPGRRYRLEVLNKSSIVLITAFWEAYCEDLAAEALSHLVKSAKNVSVLPKGIKKQVANELKTEKDELAIWKLGDDGWRQVLMARLSTLQKERNRKLNTPKTANIDDLFMHAIGLPCVSDSWKWNGISPKVASNKLDAFIELRGSIAHRGTSARPVKKATVQQMFSFIRRLVAKTGGRVNTYVKGATGKKLF